MASPVGRLVPRLCLAAVTMHLALGTPVLDAQGPATPTGAFGELAAREWVTFLASDTLQGREVFTEGYGMAASYVAEHLRAWGLRPLGDNGTFLQSVSLGTYRVTPRSSVTVAINGRSHRFVTGDHVQVPIESGGRQTLTFSSVVFVTDGRAGAGGAVADPAERTDLAGRFVAYVPDPDGPRGRASQGDDTDVPTRLIRRAGVAGVVTFVPGPSGRATTGGAGRSAATVASTLTTVGDVHRVAPPAVTADETFFEALVSGSGAPFSAWRGRLRAGQPRPDETLTGVTVTVAIDNQIDMTSIQRTANVVGMVEGTDPALRSRYVLFGAHLDHVGYSRGTEPKGRANTPVAEDPIWNGADDNASGTAGLMAIARAIATGPRPRRSVVFVWHAGEESGMLGSRYMVDFPVVPMDRVEAMFNIDMIGRNRDDRADEANTLYVIGADRISTDLHNVVVQTNAATARPMTLDFEYNDPSDVQSFYTRSDHYSYAERGIPIAFFFTGTHDDYHANTDTADRILYPKLVRVAELVYRIGFAVADREAPLERDYRGARAGRGFKGLIGAGAR